MKNRLLGVLFLFTMGILAACSGEVELKVMAGSNQDSGWKSPQDITRLMEVSNKVIFSPDYFNVEIVEVAVRQGLEDSWVKIFDGSQWMNIVVPAELVSTPALLPEGEYRGIAIGYRENWDLGRVVSSNELPTVIIDTNYFDYVETNTSTNLNYVLFATSDLQAEVASEYPDYTENINLLQQSIVFTKNNTYVLNLEFLTASMIEVWTNNIEPTNPDVVIVEPDLNISTGLE